MLRQFERVGQYACPRRSGASGTAGTVRSLTKNSPAKTTGAHVCVIGHITQDELLRYLDRTELANGFANRLLLACVKRSQRLPFGGALPAGALDRLGRTRTGPSGRMLLRAGERRVCFTRDARDLWAASYDALTEDRPGIYGAITARAEAQVLRLSLIYALLDESRARGGGDHRCPAPAGGAGGLALLRRIGRPHLRPRPRRSCRGRDPTALLQHAPLGVTRNDIINHFGRHRGASAIGRALALLLQHGLARFETNPTGGRPEERWYAV